MAIEDKKEDVKLGKTKAENIKNIDANFVSLFDTVYDLNTAIGGKEDSIGAKGSAFNKDFEGTPGNIKMNGDVSVGSSNNIPRADHVHPTDTTRLAVKPDGTNLLIKDNKINTAYLPDSILGQLYYKGVWYPSNGGTSSSATTAATTNPQKGDYYIAANDGNYNPQKNTVANVSYNTGDWAVYNGTSWDKIDNTDAVKTVNGQIGNVKTYKGDYAAASTYYNGDIVKHITDGCLYLCIASGTSKGVAPSNTTNWKIFGKIYSNATTTASGLMSFDDKKKLDGVEAGAQANKEAFSQINIGNTEIKATDETDTFKILAGTNVKLTADTAKKQVTIEATDTTYSVMTGATESAPGSQGLVPEPLAGSQNKFLKGDGTWAVPKIAKTYQPFEVGDFATSADRDGLYPYATGLISDNISILRVYKGNDTNGYKEADVMIGITKETNGSAKYTIYTDEKFDGMIEYISHSAS